MKIKETSLPYEAKLSKEIEDAINLGIKAVEEGRVIPHDEAMRQIRAELGFEEV